jgi:predicted unusual protein kinase regulating ubiquinone biosynthesis (AarF/ABC1/UbiB family)
MEFMDGVKINELETLDALGVDRHQVAVNLLEIYLQMLLGDGFFHADPHPGNIFVRPDGVIQLIDFGQVGRIGDDLRAGLTELIVAVFSSDSGAVVESLQHLGFLAPGADTRLIEEGVMPLIQTMMGDLPSMMAGESFLDTMMSGRGMQVELERFNIDSKLLDDLREFILTQPISLPGNITFLGKALITVITDVYALDPKLDVVAVLEPYVRQALPGANIWQTVFGDGLELLRELPATAKRLVSLSKRLDSGQLEVRLSEAQLAKLRRGARRQLRLTQAVAAGSALVALAALLRRR